MAGQSSMDILLLPVCLSLFQSVLPACLSLRMTVKREHNIISDSGDWRERVVGLCQDIQRHLLGQLDYTNTPTCQWGNEFHSLGLNDISDRRQDSPVTVLGLALNRSFYGLCVGTQNTTTKMFFFVCSYFFSQSLLSHKGQLTHNDTIVCRMLGQIMLSKTVEMERCLIEKLNGRRKQSGFQKTHTHTHTQANFSYTTQDMKHCDLRLFSPQERKAK